MFLFHSNGDRKRLEAEHDKCLRDKARLALVQLEEMLSRGLTLIEGNREHPGIKAQADRGAYSRLSLSLCVFYLFVCFVRAGHYLVGGNMAEYLCRKCVLWVDVLDGWMDKLILAVIHGSDNRFMVLPVG